MRTKAYYIRTEAKPVPELEFDSYGLAQQVAKAMSQTFCIGSYKVLYVVRNKDNVALVRCTANNADIKPDKSFPGDAL